jgi:hypothetical protein
MSNPIAIFGTTQGFQPYPIQQEVVILKKVHVFKVGKYSKTLQLLANQRVFKGVLKRVQVCTKIDVKGATVKLFYGALGDFTFDLKNWKWNRQVEL